MKVSIIIPVFNDEKHISETIDSVINQSYKDWECIIVNDGSHDKSFEIIYKKIENDTRFQLFNKENTGVSDTRNFAISKAKGAFILPLDSDDLIGENYLLEAVKIFSKHPNTTLVYCKAMIFGDKKSMYKLPEYKYEDLIVSNSIFASAIYKKSDFLKTNGYDVNLVYGLEDWEFWIQLLDKNSIVYKINDFHFYYRIRSNSRNTLHNDFEKIHTIHNYIFEKHKDKYYELLFENQPKFYSLYNIFSDLKKFELVKKSVFYKPYKIVREIKKPFKKLFIFEYIFEKTDFDFGVKTDNRLIKNFRTFHFILFSFIAIIC
jgi:glycosyltransferase involved in cell wall biosynthesis